MRLRRGARRIRRRNRSGIRRRSFRRTRIGRRRTGRSISGRFAVDGCRYTSWLPGDNTSAPAPPAQFSQDAKGGQLNAYYATGTNSNAYVIRFDFPISYLALVDPSYLYISQLYDQVRCNKCGITLRCNVAPKSQVTTPMLPDAAPLAEQYDFTSMVDNQPDCTWIDYDGYGTIFTTSVAGAKPVPANGDVTNSLGERYKKRYHRAFGTIKRTLNPKFMQPAIQNVVNPTDPTSALTTVVRSGHPWSATQTPNLYYGSIFLAISYKGPPTTNVGNTNVNFQPLYYWSVRSWWNLTYRSALWG